jgi:uncharacterized membrane protein
MPPTCATPTASQQVERNIDAVASLERSELEERSWSDRAVDAVASFLGSIVFVIIHVAWFATWMVLNRSSAPYPFDPYPHSLLTLLVSLEAILLSTFVLMSQNRMMKAAARRTHLDLQINLLAESEMTIVLRTLRAITAHLGIQGVAPEEAMRELLQDTSIQHVARVLNKKLDETVDGPANPASITR